MTPDAPVGTKRPQLKLLISEPRPAMWMSEKPAFHLHHVGGDAARNIQIDPVTSRRFEDLELRFESVDLLDSTRRVAPVPVLLKGSGERRTASFETDFFRLDCVRAVSVSYPVVVRFTWREQEDADELNFVWDARQRVVRVTAG